MSLIELCYYSTPIKKISDEELRRMLCGARERNCMLDVSGLLLCSNNFFLQILEGSREAVNAIFQSISHDSRHNDIAISYVNEITFRQFRSWRMAYISDLELRELTGLADFNPYSMSAAAIRSLVGNIRTGL